MEKQEKLKCNPLIIEMTGIMGAGYLPGLFKPITSLLQENFILLIGDNKKRKKLTTRRCIDNELARNADDKRWKMMIDLIERIPDLNQNEWDKLINSLWWVDDLLIEDINSYKYTVHIALRRGGTLHDYTLFHDERWKDVWKERLPSRLQFFLWADYELIKKTFDEDEETIEVRKMHPELYYKDADVAFDKQNEWYNTVKDRCKAPKIIRQDFSKEEYAKNIIDDIIRPIKEVCEKEHDWIIRHKKEVFISYSRKDSSFVEKLEAALKQNDIRSWRDKREMELGVDIPHDLKNAIASSQYFCIIVSKNSTESKWVERELRWAKRYRKPIIPIIIDEKLQKIPFSLKLINYSDFRKIPFDEGVRKLIIHFKKNIRTQK